MSASLAAEHTLRIAFYCNLMAWPKRTEGGVRQWVLAMANGLVARGYIVDVLSEAPDQHFRDEPLLDSRANRVILGKGLTAWMRLDKYVKDHPGVRLVAALNYYNLRAAHLKSRFGDRVHVTVVQQEQLSADAEWQNSVVHWLTAIGVRRYFNYADAVVPVSDGVGNDLRVNFGVRSDRLRTIHNPAYREDFLEAAKNDVDHPWLNDKTVPVIIAVGRLHYVKGFDVLFKAFARVRQQMNVRLIILGEGKERESLTRQIAELGLTLNVSLPGRMPVVAPWMARADLFVLSSRREGLPTVLIEALASGLAVVATRCPSGPEEILEQGRWGTLVDVGDVDGLAAAILSCLRGPPVNAAELRLRASDFSLDRAVDRYLEVWRRPPVAE